MIEDQMMDHLRNFLEKPHELFSNLPVCPFAKQARTENKIDFFVNSLVFIEELDTKITEFMNQNHYEVLWLIHPNCIITSDETDEIAKKLSEKYPKELEFLSGHPHSEFTIGGLHTRREPFPNIVVQKVELLERKRKLLKNTKYYNKL